MGEDWGSLLSDGMGYSPLQEAVLKVATKITHSGIMWHPQRRTRFSVKIPLQGTLLRTFEQRFKVTGKKSFWLLLFLLLEEEDEPDDPVSEILPQLIDDSGMGI
jgi:hypothetical protein